MSNLVIVDLFFSELHLYNAEDLDFTHRFLKLRKNYSFNFRTHPIRTNKKAGKSKPLPISIVGMELKGKGKPATLSFGAKRKNSLRSAIP